MVRKIIEIAEWRSKGICCLQETRFTKSLVRMISRKAAEYELFEKENEKNIGRIRIFLVKKWVDEVIDKAGKVME